MRVFLICLLLTGCSTGRVYVEFGAGWIPGDQVYETPVSSAKVGFETNDGWIVEAEHISSIPDTNDVGLETYWISKRVYIK